MKVTSLRLEDDIYNTISECICISDGRSINKMINILLAEAINARDVNFDGSNQLNTITGKFKESLKI